MTTPELLSLPMLRKLIGFDTTSRNPNLDLIDYVRDYLSSHGVESHLTYDDTKRKANLFATVGPGDAPGGLILFLALCNTPHFVAPNQPGKIDNATHVPKRFGSEKCCYSAEY